MLKIVNKGISSSKITIIAGRVLQMGVPIKSTVKVLMQKTGVAVKLIDTDSSGFYKAYVPLGLAYTLYAQDKTKVFNAVIQDNVVPK